jgi:hypothetical protein
MTWQLLLALAAAFFGGFIIWQNRPSLGPRRVGKARRQALAAARAKIAAATTPSERAEALCDAGDSSAIAIGSPTSAVGYYLRAMRTDPSSAEPIVRAARGLVRRPRTLESLLWRRLAVGPWEGSGRPAALAALAALGHLYEGPLRNRSKGRAIAHALAALGYKPPVVSPEEAVPNPS